MLDAILDFSARHHFCLFMPAVPYPTNSAEHFDIWYVLLYRMTGYLIFLAWIVTLPEGSAIGALGVINRINSGTTLASSEVGL